VRKISNFFSFFALFEQKKLRYGAKNVFFRAVAQFFVRLEVFLARARVFL